MIASFTTPYSLMFGPAQNAEPITERKIKNIIIKQNILLTPLDNFDSK
jgi:hypothetical protein